MVYNSCRTSHMQNLEVQGLKRKIEQMEEDNEEKDRKVKRLEEDIEMFKWLLFSQGGNGTGANSQANPSDMNSISWLVLDAYRTWRNNISKSNITILLPIENTQIQTPTGGKTVNLAGRMTQAVAALLRRLGLPHQGNASYGKVRILGVVLKKWLQPKLHSSGSGKSTDLSLSQTRLGKEIIHQQRNIRTGNLSLD